MNLLKLTVLWFDMFVSITNISIFIQLHFSIEKVPKPRSCYFLLEMSRQTKTMSQKTRIRLVLISSSVRCNQGQKKKKKKDCL